MRNRIILLLLWTPLIAFTEEITVYGERKSSPLEFIPTVAEISGAKLKRKRQSTIGETLARESGVTSSQFGPNASRPVIRGMDGDRIRVLQNGTGVLDASAASQDHAVALDPLVVDRVEVVRGPAALLYGSSAVGGVINMATSRIPESRPENFEGKAELRASSIDQGRSGAFAAKLAAGPRAALHADVSARGAEDYRAPKFGRVYNGFHRTTSEALGGSYLFGDKGFLGSSFSNYDSNYGTVAERFVNIRMRQQRWDVAGETREQGLFRSVRFENSFSSYKHEEIEDGETGTRFKNEGDEARIDLKHRPVMGMAGVLGVQLNTFNFSVEGEEAFLPSTENRAYSLFAFEEKTDGTFRPSLGGRLDFFKVTAPTQSRSFDTASASTGFLLKLSEAHSLVLNLALTQRAPNYQELFANGRHVATRQFEVGDSALGIERSQSAEVSWRYKTKSAHGHFGIFLQDFKNYIFLAPTGVDDGDPEDPFEISRYQAIAARFSGAEFEYHQVFGRFELEWKADFVRARNRDPRENLPRTPPPRESVALFYKREGWQMDLQIERTEKQSRTAPGESETDAYTLVHIGAETLVNWENASLSVFGRVNNLFHQEARNHVSVLKEIAPPPGRNIVVGVQAVF